MSAGHRNCIYDNPSTMRREWWCDGKMVGFLCFELLAQSSPDITYYFPAAKRPWKSGEVVGDATALVEGGQ